MAADMGGPAVNNSSDFVRKLYKMLEDPTYDTIVRWGTDGDSFVVLENEKFTKTILPKHFKHSNFASFVRQLNKYDFHKVRQNNEENAASPYGPGAWEFKHPEFQMNKKDNLDNIRRKAPAPRKAATSIDDAYPSQQLDLVSSQLMATQQQLQQVTEQCTNLAQGHCMAVQEVVTLQKVVKSQNSAIQYMMKYLRTIDLQKRNSPNGAAGKIVEGALDDHPSSPLQAASAILEEVAAANLPNKDLEQMTLEYSMREDYSTPPNDAGAIPMAQQAGPSTAHGYHNDLDNVVYPVGHTNGIDPLNSEHMNNIPYSLPATMLPSDPNMMSQISEPAKISRKKEVCEPVWGHQKPRILLVEDDKVCARIGSKFLQAFECGVEIARDGLEAVNKMNNGQNQFDLILMDIIMPNLDGVSATVCIREIRPHIPIIAMTSNIRTDDIEMYFRYGMNDVLPKPFTKEGMLRFLEKHLTSFKKDAAPQPPAQFQNPAPMAHPGGFVTPLQAHGPPVLTIGQMPAPQRLKEESSPGQSPAAVSWSPGLGTSPTTAGPFMQPMRDGPYNMTSSHPPPGYQSSNVLGGDPRMIAQRRLADITGGPTEGQAEKRQRLTSAYAAPPGYSR